MSNISSSFMPRVVTAGVPRRMPPALKGLCVSNGIAFLFTVMPAWSSTSETSLPVMILRLQIDEHEMVVGRARDDAEAVFLHAFAERLGVADDLLLVGLELGPERFAERDRLGRDDVHERAALHAGKHLRVDFLRVLFLAEDEAAARAAQRLVRGGGDEIGIGNRRRMDARRDESRDVRHVDEEQRAARIGDLAQAREIDRCASRPKRPP